MGKLNVLVLRGGPSPEHEVSLNTGAMIAGALDKEKYNVRSLTITKEGQWLDPMTQENLGDAGRALAAIEREHPVDVAMIAMHGAYGEDGTVQGFLELAGIPYTGSGVLASALAMDKIKSRELFAAHGLSVPREGEDVGFPCVVKPARCGSSVGVSIVRTPEELPEAIRKASEHDDEVVIQEYIEGTEVTCGVLDEGGGTAFALPPTMIAPKTATFFDYRAKYEPGASEEITPAPLPPEVTANIQACALAAHAALGCYGMSRTDMIIRGDTIYVLETNTIPGMTATSLLPQAAAAAGIAFPELLDRLIRAALKRR